MKTYILAYDEYIGICPNMEQFKGTWRQLLERVNGINDDNRKTLRFDDFPERGTLGTMSELELIEQFNTANGDGQPYLQVWCVEEGKQVLGAIVKG